jgi:DivIVA domain-containing protein
MAAVELDRQAIEKRDFPIGRRGYDPASVDAHLRALAAEVEELQRAIAGRGAESSLASTASTQVQSILEAAETTAAEIERQALQEARETREVAGRDAEQTRDEAIKQARRHVAAVSQATSILLQRVESMDGEVGALVEALRAGASRLANDLTAVETNMGELYDVSAGRGTTATEQASSPAPTQASASVGEAELDAPPEPLRAVPAESSRPVHTAVGATPPVPTTAAREPTVAPAAVAAAGGGDVDGARLIALNMALNGESRAQTDRYLAENFQLENRQQLLEEVYAAIEG